MNPGLRAELEPALLAVRPERVTGAPRIGVERRIEPIAPEWDELARRTGASPFLRPGWAAAWWRAFGAGRLEIWTLRREGRLAAVLPMLRRGGTLRSATNWHTPEFGLLAESAGAAAELARALYSERRGTRISLAALGDGDPALAACRAAALERDFRVLDRPYQFSPYLAIDRAWEEYESGLSRNLRLDLDRSRRRLERMGRLTVEVADGSEGLDALLREAFAVEASGWKGDDRTAIQSSAETRRFYDELARWAAERGMLRLYFLRLGRRALSSYYGLEDDGVLHLLKGGYEAEFRRYSPGKLLIHAALERAHRDGCRRVEFHGDAEPYKLRWTSAVHERRQLDAYPPSAAGFVHWVVRARLRPALKRLLRRDVRPVPPATPSAPATASAPSAHPDGGPS